MSHLSRQLKQINSVTGGGNQGSYNPGSSYPRDREQFKEKVMSDHYRSVTVKGGRGGRGGGQYRVDNRNRRGGGSNYNDHDDDRNDGRHRPGVKDRTRPNHKNQHKKHNDWKTRRNDDGRMDRMMDDGLIDDIHGRHDWIRVQMTIPKSEQTRRVEFQQEMLTKFAQSIPNFADKDAHCENLNVIFYLPFENSDQIFRQMIDLINDIRPSGVSPKNFIKINKFPANAPISAKFQNINNAMGILQSELQSVYDVPSKTLDLSNWSHRPNLQQNGMKMELFRGEHMALLVRILLNFPLEAMEGLNLSNNRLRNLQQLGPLVAKLPNLKNMILKGNKDIRSWDDLKYVQGWKIETLDVTDCPLSKTVVGRNAIKISKEARRVFKSLKSFNGKELCAGFDLGTTEAADPVSQLPAERDSVLPSQEGLEGPLIGFIGKFITAYDTNREELFHCYASDAVLTLSCGRGTDLQAYRKHQRNLVNYRHFQDPQSDKFRSQHPNTIKRKKLGVIATLEDLPKSKHDLLNSCFLDVTLEVPEIIGFTLTGTFKETETGIVRFFSRHILCSFNPEAKSFVISHDQYHIRAASEKEKDNHGVKQPVEPQPAKGSRVPEQQDASIKKFMQESGMNEQYSKLCLAENDWNYNKAAEKFLELKKNSQIPPDAWQPGRQP